MTGYTREPGVLCVVTHPGTARPLIDPSKTWCCAARRPLLSGRTTRKQKAYPTAMQPRPAEFPDGWRIAIEEHENETPPP